MMFKSINHYTPIGPTGLYNLEDAVAICKMIEPCIADFGFHVALTGGTLYGEGGRKDIDLVFYRIRQQNQDDIKMDKLYLHLEDTCDLVLEKDHGFCKKFLLGEVVPIDILFPEDWSGTYGLDHLANEKESFT